MINAVPSSANSSSGAGASPMPPATPIGVTAGTPNTTAAPMLPPQVMSSHGANPHGIKPPFNASSPITATQTPFSTAIPDSTAPDTQKTVAELGEVNTGEIFAKDLKDKLNGLVAREEKGFTPLPVMPATPVSAAPTDGTTGFSTPPEKPKNKSAMKSLLAVLVFGLVVAGAGAGYYLTTNRNANLDDRNRAASEEVTGTERFNTDAEWKTFNQKWVEFNKTKHTWQEIVAYSQAEGARYECQKPILQVDKEIMYGCDLNALFAIKNNTAYIQAKSISPQSAELNEILDHLITNSSILQTAATTNIVKLSPQNFNSATKSTEQRFADLTTARTAIEKDFVKKIDFEAVTIYFHNEIDPVIPLEQAKTAAKTKMDNLYTRIKSGAITMEQAGAEIAADKIVGDTTGISLAQLDPRKVYPENAYARVSEHGFDDQIFTDPVYDQELKSLGEGQISTVRTCKDYKFTFQEFKQSNLNITKFPFVDSCYIIFKLNKIKYGVNKTLEGTTQQEVEEKIKNTVKVTKLTN